jgi:hypothetical protein
MQSIGEAANSELKIVENEFVESWNDVRRVAMDACKCTSYDCGCCAHLEEREIHLNSTSKTLIVTEQVFHFAGSPYLISLCIHML